MSTETWQQRMDELKERLNNLGRWEALERQKLLMQIHIMHLENEREQ